MTRQNHRRYRHEQTLRHRIFHISCYFMWYYCTWRLIPHRTALYSLHNATLHSFYFSGSATGACAPTRRSQVLCRHVQTCFVTLFTYSKSFTKGRIVGSGDSSGEGPDQGNLKKKKRKKVGIRVWSNCNQFRKVSGAEVS
jgi:hypothetical protein